MLWIKIFMLPNTRSILMLRVFKDYQNFSKYVKVLLFIVYYLNIQSILGMADNSKQDDKLDPQISDSSMHPEHNDVRLRPLEDQKDCEKVDESEIKLESRAMKTQAWEQLELAHSPKPPLGIVCPTPQAEQSLFFRFEQHPNVNNDQVKKEEEGDSFQSENEVADQQPCQEDYVVASNDNNLDQQHEQNTDYSKHSQKDCKEEKCDKQELGDNIGEEKKVENKQGIEIKPASKPPTPQNVTRPVRLRSHRYKFMSTIEFRHLQIMNRPQLQEGTMPSGFEQLKFTPNHRHQQSLQYPINKLLGHPLILQGINQDYYNFGTNSSNRGQYGLLSPQHQKHEFRQPQPYSSKNAYAPLIMSSSTPRSSAAYEYNAAREVLITTRNQKQQQNQSSEQPGNQEGGIIVVTKRVKPKELNNMNQSNPPSGRIKQPPMINIEAIDGRIVAPSQQSARPKSTKDSRIGDISDIRATPSIQSKQMSRGQSLINRDHPQPSNQDSKHRDSEQSAKREEQKRAVIVHTEEARQLLEDSRYNMLTELRKEFDMIKENQDITESVNHEPFPHANSHASQQRILTTQVAQNAARQLFKINQDENQSISDRPIYYATAQNYQANSRRLGIMQTDMAVHEGESNISNDDEEDQFLNHQLTIRQHFENNQDISMKSFISFLLPNPKQHQQYPKQLNSSLHLSQILLNPYDEPAESEEFSLQDAVDSAQRGDIIELPAKRIKLDSLLLWKPVTLIGKPETVLEIRGGQIKVDFNYTEHDNDQPIPDRKHPLARSDNLSKLNIKTIKSYLAPNNYPQIRSNSTMNQELRLKRSDVVTIQEVHIEFNRNLAQEQQNQEKRDESLKFEDRHSTMRFGVTNTRLKENTTTAAGTQTIMPQINSSCPVGCIVIANQSYLELRDCYIQSIKDPAVIESDKEAIIQARLNGCPEPDLPDVEDYCFALNLQSILPTDQNTKETLSSDYLGVVSLQSTTVSDFHYGILGGFQSIMNLEKSSIINVRGTTIKAVNPKIFKLNGCVFQKACKGALDIRLVDQSPYIYNPLQKSLCSKIIISGTRFISIDDFTLSVMQVSEQDFKESLIMSPIIHSTLTSYQHLPGGQMFNASVKFLNNKLYSCKGVSLENLSLKLIDISQNDYIKCPGSAALSIMNVRAYNLECKRVSLSENLIQESSGIGIFIVQSTCQVENNEIVKSESDGIRVKNQEGCIVQILNTLCKDNQGCGLKAINLTGFLDIQDSIMSGNNLNGVQVEGPPTQGSSIPSYLIIYRVELKSNKHDGLKLKGTKCNAINCNIQQNRQGAICLEGGKQQESMTKLCCDPKQTNDIKGKIYGDSGLLYPRIMIQDDIESIARELRKMYFQELRSFYERQQMLQLEIQQKNSNGESKQGIGKNQTKLGSSGCFSSKSSKQSQSQKTSKASCFGSCISSSTKK